LLPTGALKNDDADRGSARRATGACKKCQSDWENVNFTGDQAPTFSHSLEAMTFSY
jgi:hypothetical protein